MLIRAISSSLMRLVAGERPASQRGFAPSASTAK